MEANAFASFYQFSEVVRPMDLRISLLEQCESDGIMGTIILSHEGINGSIIGSEDAISSLLEFVEKNMGFNHLLVNRSQTLARPFDRLVVRVKEEIVTSGFKDQTLHTSNYIDPEEWDSFIEQKNVIPIDVRNFYEHSIGSFINAIRPDIRSFRQFPEFASKQLEENKDKKLGIFCTGGIRCEKASHLLKSLGHEQVYQLKGGIFNYFKSNRESKDSLWYGDCFVFDKRLAVDRNFKTINYQQCPNCKGMISKKDKSADDIEWAVCSACAKKAPLKSNKS